MIEGYDEIMNEWAAPRIIDGCCCDSVTISPECDMERWAVQKTIMMLANSDYYYTKDEVDYLLREITKDGVTREEVERMIAAAISTKANQADLEALSAQVVSNTERILNTYTKQETNALLEAYLTKLQANEMFANYSKVENTTLVLNADNLGITI